MGFVSVPQPGVSLKLRPGISKKEICWMNKDPINCIKCGRFCCYETMVMVSFTPDNAFGPEESLFKCKKCHEIIPFDRVPQMTNPNDDLSDLQKYTEE
jgi:hypothetical protein